ncbi:hypothetical protein P0Y35_04775 [Kiritimatiellaeota bacterium B1221]|nr:hypothetical protein [Kiritimatiellaeota bacterium B1221]
MKNHVVLRGIFLVMGFWVTGLLGAVEVSDEEAMVLGRQVLAVKEALANPQAPASLDTVTALGQDSRYAVMVRGWLVQHIRMAESYRGTSEYQNSPAGKLEVEKSISSYQKMLRRIDLE